MEGLEALVESGKIRALGVSNLDPWDLREAAAALRVSRIACNQVLYNLRERTIEDHELPWARENDCAVVAYTPLGRLAAPSPVLEGIAKLHGVTAAAAALAFLVRDPLVFAVPKANRIEHVEANAAAGDLRLSDDEIAAIEAANPKRKRKGPLPTN
jgi:diketogulonate reductase-like aldo/keto reductase